jgi:hypothetical protein
MTNKQVDVSIIHIDRHITHIDRHCLSGPDITQIKKYAYRLYMTDDTKVDIYQDFHTSVFHRYKKFSDGIWKDTYDVLKCPGAYNNYIRKLEKNGDSRINIVSKIENFYYR